MKKPFNPVIPDYTPKNVKKEEPSVKLELCCTCGKEVQQGYYGRHGYGGTCSAKCEKEFKKPSYIKEFPNE